MAKRKKQKQDETLIDVMEKRDQFQSYYEQNQVKIIGLAAGVLLLIGAFLAYSMLYKTPREKQAKEAMYKAEYQFERDSFNLALINPGDGFEGFLDIIDNYSGTKAANLSKYYAGISYLNIAKFEAAIDYLEEFNASGDVLTITKYGALGDAHAELNDFDAALSNYKKAANSNNEALTPYYLRKVALLELKNGNDDAARDAYARINEDFPNSTQGIEAKKYIAKLSD